MSSNTAREPAVSIDALLLRVAQLEDALAACLRFAPGGIDDAEDRQGPAVQTWINAWELIEGTDADWRRRV